MLRLSKFSTDGLKRAALVAGFGLITVVRLQAGTEGSLTDLNIEYNELKLALENVLADKKQLSSALADTQKTLADMRQNLAAASAETEVFKRRSMELTLRMEALGLDLAGANNSRLEQRLLASVSDLRVVTKENKVLSEALMRLADVSAGYAKSASGAPAAARLALEGEIRNANKALGVPSTSATDGPSVFGTLNSAIAISVKEDLSLVVINLGSKEGVKVGMPFRVVRDQVTIGTVQVVEVREKLSGAVIQNISSEREPIKVGDRLVVDAR